LNNHDPDRIMGLSEGSKGKVDIILDEIEIFYYVIYELILGP